MKSQEFLVFIDIEGRTYFVGRLWCYFRNGRETASFEYDQSWLTNPLRFSLEPALALSKGKFHTEKSLFGSLGDSAPDRWGRILMRRFEADRNKTQQQKPHQLNEIDYLILVNDKLRQGALRFKRANGEEFLSSDVKTVPLLTDLSKLLAASHHVLENEEISEELRLLLAPGSSLGGARPKACVQDSAGNLHIAKFSRKDDEFSVVLWEAVALTLAKDAGIVTPQWQVQKDMIIIRRFDRNGQKRVPFLSAMSMLGASDNESGHSYLEIADALTQYGASPRSDLAELWRRIVFNILISNTDDHLRNHSFLYEVGMGWKLSPAYDLNPVPYRRNALSLNISETDSTQSLDLALSVAEEFYLTMDEAKTILLEVSGAVKNWKNVAHSLKISNREIELMENAFDV
ncbi:MAG: type II toxin-antitoxin system HipA family toxin [Holosporales bacterium]|jgi:serine/threonine-protein kinase HipA|nr:type II toxin-antitoxin system HipA family toxin [Holosporales bacterium]